MQIEKSLIVKERIKGTIKSRNTKKINTLNINIPKYQGKENM